MKVEKKILVIDNYDSFTFNLVHLLEQLDCDIVVRRNDEVDISDIESATHVLIGPGPGLPKDSVGVQALLEKYANTKSILGVCLGMQALMEYSGAEIINMDTVAHGAQEELNPVYSGRLFNKLPDSFRVGRYHSWGFNEESIPKEYRVNAIAKDGIVMAVEHDELPLYGIQFHPESIMTEHGLDMMRNWLNS